MGWKVPSTGQEVLSCALVVLFLFSAEVVSVKSEWKEWLFFYQLAFMTVIKVKEAYFSESIKTQMRIFFCTFSHTTLEDFLPHANASQCSDKYAACKTNILMWDQGRQEGDRFL